MYHHSQATDTQGIWAPPLLTTDGPLKSGSLRHETPHTIKREHTRATHDRQHGLRTRGSRSLLGGAPADHGKLRQKFTSKQNGTQAKMRVRHTLTAEFLDRTASAI